MWRLGRLLMCAALIALGPTERAGAAETLPALGFNSHMLPDRPVADPYATKPDCAGKIELAPARRYLQALRSDVASVEAWRSRTGHYPDGAFPLQQVGGLSPQYVRTRSGFGFVLKFRPFSSIRPLFACSYLSIATVAQLNQRGLPWQAPNGSSGSVFAFTPQTGLYLVGELKK